MLFLVNDWYWKDKSKPLQALESLVEVKQQSGVLIDTFTLGDGWDFDWDHETKIWGRLNRERFPGGWDALQAVGRAADIDVSHWFGPIGGYTYRPRRIEFERKIGFEIQGDKLCLCGAGYKKHVIESFSHWAARGMDDIKVDGFWPDCPVAEHGHPVGPAGAIAQMDGLIDVFAAWRKARRDEPGALESTLADWILLADAARSRTLRVRGVYGKTGRLDGSHPATAPLRIELAPFQISVFEVQLEPA